MVQRNVQQLVQQLVELNGLDEGARGGLASDSYIEQPILMPRQQQAQDAMDLAELIYDVFVANEASGNMGEKG